MNKVKYDIFSLIIVVITIVTLAVGALMFGSFTSEFGQDLRTDMQDTYGATQEINDSTEFIADDVQQFTDNYLFWFVIASFLGIIIMGLYLDFEPATMVIIFLVGTVVIAGAWLGGNVYEGFKDEVTSSGNMTKTNLIMDSTYLPVFILVCLIILVVIMYNRKKSGGYQ